MFNNITLDHQDYHLKENNVKFNLFLRDLIKVYIQIQILVPSYHNHN